MMTHHLRCCLTLLLLGFCPSAPAAGEAPSARGSEDAQTITMENGRIALEVSKKKAAIVSIKDVQDGRWVELGRTGQAMYFDSNGGPRVARRQGRRPRGGYAPLGSYADSVRLVRNGPEAAEVELSGGPTPWFPFRTEVHYVLPRGQSGFYAYVRFERREGLPAAGLGQTRFVVKGVPGTRTFTHHIVDDRRKGPFPTARVVETVQDATVRLEDGTVYTKYDYSAYLADHHVHGMAGHGVGVWMIFPSNEFVGGGPVKQELTVHVDNVLLAMLQGGHYGSGGIRFEDGEPWTKLFGPVFVYVNHGPSIDALWADAKGRARAEMAKWPYTWLKDRAYPLERGTVSGRIRLAGGGSTRGAWVVLAPPGDDWTQSSKGYDFWTTVDAEGRFRVEKVRPGRYTLSVSGADQFEDFHREGVEVRAGQDTDLGDLKWKPVEHGRRLWQIGIADRSSHEFKRGDDCRHWGNFLRYPRDFPEDVTFVIGKSKEGEDWNFAQWSWYCKKPYWTIRFDLERAPRGQATLTLGLASVQPPRGGRTNLQVKVNGRLVSTVRLPKSGAAGYRSGCMDSTYNVVYVPFDAALLRPGANEITLGHAEAAPFPPEERRRGIVGDVMYDALRLEVDATGSTNDNPQGRNSETGSSLTDPSSPESVSGQPEASNGL